MSKLRELVAAALRQKTLEKQQEQSRVAGQHNKEEDERRDLLEKCTTVHSMFNVRKLIEQANREFFNGRGKIETKPFAEWYDESYDRGLGDYGTVHRRELRGYCSTRLTIKVRGQNETILEVKASPELVITTNIGLSGEQVRDIVWWDRNDKTLEQSRSNFEALLAEAIAEILSNNI